MKLVFTFSSNVLELFRNGTQIPTTQAEFGFLCSLAHSAKIARTTGAWSGELELHDAEQVAAGQPRGLPVDPPLKGARTKQAG
jgi:hypothetical protein